MLRKKLILHGCIMSLLLMTVSTLTQVPSEFKEIVLINEAANTVQRIVLDHVYKASNKHLCLLFTKSLVYKM